MSAPVSVSALPVSVLTEQLQEEEEEVREKASASLCSFSYSQHEFYNMKL